jgi:hypothetical protein
MVCQQCQRNPLFHSFEHLGAMPNGCAIFFSSIEKAHHKIITKDSLPDYAAHLDIASQTPWVWIIDCRGMKTEHIPKLKVCRLLVDLFEERYKHVLKNVFLVHPTWHVNVALGAVKPLLPEETKSKIVACPSPLTLLEKGVPTHVVKSCTS